MIGFECLKGIRKVRFSMYSAVQCVADDDVVSGATCKMM